MSARAHFGLFLVAIASTAGSAFASTPTNWIERDGLRYAARIDAGTVVTGRELAAELVLQNTGEQPLWIERLAPTCGCTVVDWSASFLAPGETRRPAVRLEPYDIPGHHRHTVYLVGAAEQPLGTVIVSADALADRAAGADFLAATEFIDAGIHRAGQALQLSLPLHNLSGRTLDIRWSLRRAGELLASSSSGSSIPATARTTIPLQFVAPSDLWGSSLELSDGVSTLVLPVRGHWQDDAPQSPIRRGALGLSGARARGEDLILDFGRLALGETATRTLRIRNHGDQPLELLRAFTSARGEFELRYQPGVLAPQASTELTVVQRGVQRPGSFRAIIHLLFDGAPALSVHARGFVQSVPTGSNSPHLESIVLEFDRRRPTIVRIHDASGQELLQSNSLDHAAYARLLEARSRTSERLCSNCGELDQSGQRIERGALKLRLLSVLGDERFDPEHAAILPHIADPNGSVIEALHPEHSSTLDAGAVPIVLFHDDFPLVEEAARRTRVSAVYVVAGSHGAATRVLPLRDVLILDPGSTDVAAGLIRLRLHVRANQILDWELLVAERS